MRRFLKSLFQGKRSDAADGDADLDETPKPAVRLTSTAMKINSENVGIFLHWLNANSAIRLPEEFIDDVLLDMPDIPVATNRAFDTDITLNGETDTLRLNIFMDDVDVPDLRFFGSDQVIGEMKRALRAFAAELGY